MSWFLRSRVGISKKDEAMREMPDNLWTKCPECKSVIYKKQLEEALYTCPECGHHFRIGSKQYVDLLFDEGTFKEMDTDVRSADPLEFVDTKPYSDRLDGAYKKSDSDALTVGVGKIEGQSISFGCMNFGFIGGSMGSVVGEKFVRAAERARKGKMPLVVISASGGARMQEAAFSLMQMAKTSAKLAELDREGIPFISILTDPTTGGVSASFAMLGDIIIAEPKALIGFAGPRVIEQTIRKKLPEGFQRSEFLLEHGFLDMIIHRKKMKAELAKIIALLMKQKALV